MFAADSLSDVLYKYNVAIGIAACLKMAQLKNNY